MIPDKEKVIQAIRETAALEILPRFRALSEDDIFEKSPGDLVTTADTEAEKRLELLLKNIVPGSLVVGEEGAEKTPELLANLSGAAPVWLVDPVDGTYNFAHGKPCFAVIIAFCEGGETRAAWIHDPLSDTTHWAVRGGGAWTGKGASPGNTPLKTSKNRPIGEMTGSFSTRLRRLLEVRQESGKYAGQDLEKGPLPNANRYRCVGREYMDLAQGVLDFSFYGGRLKPWDHAAGALIYHEAGGYGALTGDGTPFNPAKGGTYSNTSLLLAPDEITWKKLRQLLVY